MRKFCLILLVLLVLSLLNTYIVAATDGFVAYRSNSGLNGINSPKIRFWNSSSNGSNGNFSTEFELPTAGSPIRNLVLAQSPISSKNVLVVQTDDGNISGYVCMLNCTNVSNWAATIDMGIVWNVTPAVNAKRFDIAFESNTGDLLLTYGVIDPDAGRDLGYFELLESMTSFSGISSQYLNDTTFQTNIQYSWVSMAGNPSNSSNEIVLAGYDSTSSDVNAWVWNGTNFTRYNNGTANVNIKKICAVATSAGSREALGVAYASDNSNGTTGMVVCGDGANGFINYSYWNGSLWSTVNAFDINATTTNDVNWIKLKPDPFSDDMQLVAVDSGSDLHTVYWNGSVWSTPITHDATVDAVATRVADYSWLPSGNVGRLIWDSDGASAGSLNITSCTPECNNAHFNISKYTGTLGAWLTLFTNPTITDGIKFLGFRLEANTSPDIGAFRFNFSTSNLNFSNHGDSSITGDTTVTTFESYAFGYIMDKRIPNIIILTPNVSINVSSNTTILINISSNEYLPYIIIQWNLTNITTNASSNNGTWTFSVDELSEGFYNYSIYAVDWAGNINQSALFNLVIDFPPNLTLVSPDNNTFSNNTRNINFSFNVTDSFDNVSICWLIIDQSFTANITGPLNESIINNISYILPVGQHNWSITCNDTYNLNSTSEIRNITIDVRPILSIDTFNITDGLFPDNEIFLSAGSTRTVNCSITATDPENNNSNLANATGTFYYYLNSSGNSDDNNTHYSNSNCTLALDTGTNKTFSCGFDVLYYANNGSWNCNVTVFSNYNSSSSYNSSTIIQPLYALNLTDGLDFGGASANVASTNTSVNITNFGNMLLNVTIQGYAVVIGDNLGMNCSDGTNVSISNIRFSTNNSANFTDKLSLNGSIQQLNLQVPKQINSSLRINSTYWQVLLDPGLAYKICNGYIIFNAEAS